VRFRIERDALADAVAWTARSLPARPTVPVLAGLLLEVTTDVLTVSGFDYEISTRAELAASGTEPGSTLVSGRLLAEICRSLPAQPVQLAAEGARVVLTCGAARFTLPTLAVEDYPTLPPMPEPAGSLESDVLAAAVSQVALAAGRDDTLPVLTGVRVEIDGDSLTLAATDRYRLAVRQLAWTPRQPDLVTTALVPARTLADTAKSLTTGPEVVLALATGATGEGMIGFSGGGRRTTTRLLDGEFPKYRSLLPVDSPAAALVDTAALIEAAKRVSLVAPRNTPIRLSFSAGELTLDAGGGDDASASESLGANYQGEPMTIAFNPGYLLDGLGALDSDTARMAFTTPTKPAVLTGKEPDPTYRYLLMPVRLSG
jgi:DNA polymerase III subunit beta